MRIGKQDAPYTAICTSDADSVTVRGKELLSRASGANRIKGGVIALN